MRTILALAAVLLLAHGAAAQSASEFGRASGGSISAITKAPKQFSGSLSLSHTSGGAGYGGTLGGEILEDRLWFFAAASILPTMQLSTTTPELKGIDLKATAQPVDWTTVSASFIRTTPAFDYTLPSSFLSLRSTSVLSDRMTLDFSFSQRQ